MSFLNPVNEPVLRFKSTDTGAPQINYNVRAAGDVKAVLKACLVTGYGTTASAGWAAANEVGNVIEFVSPSTSMSDYRLGIDDTSTSTTTWYYQYQNLRTNPLHNAPTKTFTYIDNTHVNNGWQLFVTARGVIFVELVYHTAINKLSARLTYLSQVKSGLVAETGVNMMFFNVGHHGTAAIPSRMFEVNYAQLKLNEYTTAQIFGASPFVYATSDYLLGISSVDMVSPLYLSSSDKKILLGALSPLLIKVVNKADELFGVSDYTVDGRPVVSICLGYSHPTASLVLSYARTILIYSDYWEY